MSIAIEALPQMVGRELGTSAWLTVDQAMVDRFAAATGDEQFIHIDRGKALETPYGGTIAHGFLLLSLLPVLSAQLPAFEITGIRYKLNYGTDRVRFVVPVLTGSRIRGVFSLTALVERGEAGWQQSIDVVIELEGSGRPALIAEWIILLMA